MEIRVSFVQQYFLTGWGGLFPGGYKPKTPLAGSWEPGGTSAGPLELDDDTPDASDRKPGAGDGPAAPEAPQARSFITPDGLADQGVYLDFPLPLLRSRGAADVGPLDAAFAALVGGTADRPDVLAADDVFAVPERIAGPAAPGSPLSPAGAALGLLGGLWLAALPRVRDREKEDSVANSASANGTKPRRTS